MAFYYDRSMNNLTASVSLSSSNNRVGLSHSIRDSIFYYEDLMGETAQRINENPDNGDNHNHPDYIMAALFDEAMFDHQGRIESKDRELKIQQLLKSIESFQSDTSDSE